MTTLHKAAREALIDEAMRLAEKMMRDSWQTGRDEAWHPSRAALEAHLRAALSEAPGEEPVAWRTFDGEGGFEFRAYKENEDYADQWDARNPHHKGWVEPLYLAARPEAPTQNVNAMFEFRDAFVAASQRVPVKRVEHQDDGSLTVVLDYWPKTQSPAPTVALTEEQIEGMLSELDQIARDCDSYEYGLPRHDDAAKQRMCRAVRDFLEGKEGGA